MMKRLKERWGITSNFQIVIIFIVFAITGSTSAYFSGPLTDYIIGVDSDLNPFFKSLFSKIRILFTKFKRFEISSFFIKFLH